MKLMKDKILIFNGSPRRNGNTSAMVESFSKGAEEKGSVPEIILTDDARIDRCRGCLRCNLLKKCVIKSDEWPTLSRKILEAETLVFATPVYFHHMTSSMKKILDRFRSFIHVQITETGLLHTPWSEWNKKIILLTCMGSSSSDEARPLEELFKGIAEIFGGNTNMETLAATRLAVQGQIKMNDNELSVLYEKLGIPQELAPADAVRNREILERLRLMGGGAAG